MSTTIIDADSIIYKAGFATEQIVYEIVAEDMDGDLVTATFDDTEDAGLWLWEIGANPAEASIEAIREAEPVENCLQIVKTMVEAINDETRASHSIVVLSGPDNFRDRVAKVKPYKGNRDKAHKPVHFGAMREYLMTNYDTLVSDDCEADDVVSILAARDEADVIAHIDKDLDQIPGRHYNYGQKVWYDQSDESAMRWFWRQVLTGDASDHVGGVYRMGPKAAEYWVDDWEPSGDRWKHTVLAYELSKKKAGCPYADRDAESVALENAQLIYLQREAGELWLPYGERGRTEDV